MARKLIVEIVGDASSYEKSLVVATRSTRKFGREMEHSVRGIASGTGALHSFGRSLAFASGGFIAFEGVSRFLTESVNAAREAGVAQRALAAQMKAGGESFKANREQIEKVATSYERFGFQNDEVVAGLTVLERGTGKLSSSLKLLQLTADIARAKNIDFGASAQAVAKVFGGQETALRRAVPGLEKNAHGWDLIREAQRKMAGQAAANTTVSERFAATLHDTEEIIGSALLPILNKYLTSLSKWLQRMNESGRLQHDVTEAVNILTGAFKVLKGILDQLNSVTGSTKNTVKALFAVFIGFKALQYASALKTIATNIGLIGDAAAVATPKVEGFGAANGAGGFGKTRAGTPAGGAGGGKVFPFLIVAPMHGSTGQEAQDFLAGNAQVVPNTGGKVFQIGSHFYMATSSGTKQLSLREVQKIVAANLGKASAKLAPASPIRTDVTTGGYGGGIPTNVQPVKRTAAQLNTWFDAMINRQLDKVQDAPIAAQVVKLRNIEKQLTKRIAATKDITRKLNLEDQLRAVKRQDKAAREALAQQFMDGLTLNLDRAGLTKGLSDDIVALNVIIKAYDKRIAAEKDIGKKQQLESEQLGYISQRNADRDQQRQDALSARRAAREAAAQAKASAMQRKIDWAEFALERAQDTKGVKDDIRALKILIAYLKQQIRLTGLTVDRARQLYQYQKQLREALHPHRTGGGGGGMGGYRDFIPARGGSVGAIPSVMPPASTPSTGFQPAGSSYQIHNLNLFGVQDVPGMEQQLQKRAMARPQTRRGPI